MEISQKTPVYVYSPKGHIKTSNNWSRVFFNTKLIIAGDGSKKTDKKWLPFLIGQPEYLVLGHHGSKTSTSKQLLKSLKKGGTAISSARKKRYGHPHPYVQKLLKKNGINLLLTEGLWPHFLSGSLKFNLCIPIAVHVASIACYF